MLFCVKIQQIKLDTCIKNGIISRFQACVIQYKMALYLYIWIIYE